MNIHWGFLDVSFLQRTVHRRVLQLWLMRQLGQMRLAHSTNGRRGLWQTLTFSLLEKHSKRLFLRKVGHWRNHSKKSSGRSKSNFCIATRTCSRLGCNFLADHAPDPTVQVASWLQRYIIWQKGHTWDNHGYDYDTACIVNQMTVDSWIRFNSMTSRHYLFKPIPAML